MDLSEIYTLSWTRDTCTKRQSEQVVLGHGSYLRHTPGCSLGWHLILVALHASHAVEILLRTAGFASARGDVSLGSMSVE